MASTTARGITKRLLRRRCRLLDAARNFKSQEESTATTTPPPSSSASQGGGATLKSFSLTSDHFGSLSSSGRIDDPPTPTEFHSNLCEMIRNAKHRVYLASLYVGAAGSGPAKQPCESEFLDALKKASNSRSSQNDGGVKVKVLLDANRALRPVPIVSTNEDEANGTNSTTSSAEAVATAIAPSNKEGYDESSTTEQKKHKNQLYLFQVLPTSLKYLPTPLNEVAGVFHIKAYIVDDMLILSGANLSEEYFSNRQDRYILIQNGGNGLVDFYAGLIDILCNHSDEYNVNDSSDDGHSHQKTDTDEFLRQIKDHFVDTNPAQAESILHNSETMAVCVPTIQFPLTGKYSTTSLDNSSIVTDAAVTNDLLQVGIEADVEDDDHDSRSIAVKFSSAYLNPTHEMVEDLQQHQNVEFLTAGRKSHGFKPKKNGGDAAVGNTSGTGWIPTVFEHLVCDVCKKLPQAKLLYWERDDWTFHSKGIWLEEQQNGELIAAMIGSGNYGERSYYRDMESNCIFIFPPTSDNDKKEGASSKASPWQELFQSEWNAKCKQANDVDIENLLNSEHSLPFYIRYTLSYIKSCF